MTPDAPQPLAMTGRQKRVIQVLTERNQEIAALFADALGEFHGGGRTGRFYLTGHAIRLFMHEMPKIFDLPTLGSLPQLSSRVANLDPIWKSGCKSACRVDGGWKGEIDGPLQELLAFLEDFFLWREEQIPKKQQIAEEVFRRSDLGPANLPLDLSQKRTKRWLQLYGYFSRVAHLGSTTSEELLERIGEVEEIVLSCLYREPSPNLDAIDAILGEEEPSA